MRATNALRDVVWPATFIVTIGYAIWYFPHFLVRFGWASDAMVSQRTPAGFVDILVLLAAMGAIIMGIVTVQTSAAEGEITSAFDRVSLFMGRVTMLLIVLLVSVMFYEVVARYVFESPTLWANELSLWMASFIFLLAGLYAMQQRSHIRIYLLYDLFPRWLQRVCDTVSTLLILTFSLAMIWGGYKEAHDKFLRWETFGTAFDPPIPATLKPLVLLIILFVAIQAIINLIVDWHKGPEIHAVVDESEIEDFVQDMGARLNKKV